MMPPKTKPHRKPAKGGGRAPAAHTPGSSAPSGPDRAGKQQDWYVDEANRAQLLLSQGQVGQAKEVFEATLARLGAEPSYRHAVIMERLGRCLMVTGQPGPAASLFRDAMEITERIAPSDGVKGLQGVLQSGLGDALRASGRLGEARGAYESALKIAEHLNDQRAQGVDLDHLGSLSLEEGRPEEALARFRGAQRLFQQLGERMPESVSWYHLGMALQQAQQWEEAGRHYLEAARIREACGDFAGAAQLRSQSAAAIDMAGRSSDAEESYRKAIEASWHTKDPIQIRRHLNSLARFLEGQSGRHSEALQAAEAALATVNAVGSLNQDVWTTYGIIADVIDREASKAEDGAIKAARQAQARNYRHIQQFGPRLLVTLAGLGEGPSYGRAVIMERLGRCFLMGGLPGVAVPLFRNAVAVTEELAPGDGVNGLRGVLHSGLGDAFRTARHLDEARTAYEAAQKIAEDLQDLRGQGVGLDHLGTLALAECRLEDALAHFKVALGIFQELRDRGAEAITRHHLGMAFEQGEAWEEAARHYLEAARIREERGDVAGAAQSRSQLAAVSEKAGSGEPGAVAKSAEGPSPANEAAEAAPAADFGVTLYEEVTTDCAFATDLLIDVRREFRIVSWAGASEPLSDDIVPVLVPRLRTCLDEDGAPRFYLPAGEPALEQRPDCVIMRKTGRELAVSGNADVVWRLIRSMDGAQTVKQILSGMPSVVRQSAADLLAALAEMGAVDVSGRPIGRFLHAATKKGFLPGGGLESDDVLRLATDGNYRAFSGASHVALAQDVPGRLQGFHALTRARRSRRDYAGMAIRREEFDALLHTACGVTGTMAWEGREVKLRAYPSSGALYAVEIYPVVFRVEGMEPAVYHYAAGEHVLDVVKPGFGQDHFVAASLPVERDMVSGAAAMICLVGRFRRHERKYGEGGYRMMVAEAGHISQNLVLGAVALGLSARPFGGVFDGLINRDLGLEEAEEQFLLSVLIGHAGGGNGEEASSIGPEDTS